MARKHRARALDEDKRRCLLCGIRVDEQRPIYLVGTVGGKIVGPYHSSCAAVAHSDEQKKGGKLNGMAEQLGLWTGIAGPEGNL
jgi:hypothetical protein